MAAHAPWGTFLLDDGSRPALPPSNKKKGKDAIPHAPQPPPPPTQPSASADRWILDDAGEETEKVNEGEEESEDYGCRNWLVEHIDGQDETANHPGTDTPTLPDIDVSH